MQCVIFDVQEAVDYGLEVAIVLSYLRDIIRLINSLPSESEAVKYFSYMEEKKVRSSYKKALKVLKI